MKRNDRKKIKNYHKHISRHEKKTSDKLKHKKVKRDMKEAVNTFEKLGSLEDNIEINMDGPKKILMKTAHKNLMKNKERKAKKAPIPVEYMELLE